MSVALTLSLALAAAAPWDAPPFTADPKAIAQAAAALPRPDGDLDLLLEEATFSFDAERRATWTYRLVYRALTREAAKSWGEVRQDWAPWRQARPEIRARVILPDGEARALDPSTLVEGDADDPEDEIYSDRRSLRGPLPALAAGVVVEQVTIVRDTAPPFETGSSYRFYFGWGPPTRVARLRVEAPATLPLRHAARGLSLVPREQVEAGRRVLLWERLDSPAPAPREAWLPRAEAAPPHVAFSTGRSWADVAAAYAAVVEERLGGGPPPALRDVAAGETPERAARRALDWIAARVRYTGLELGQAAIVPAAPAETLARGYGDCKDLSLLLVAALRAAGHPAHLALVRTRWDELSPAVPGIGEFDHAIVHVGGPRPFFVDPTDPDLPVGELPLGVQGRRALVAARGTKELVLTPELPAASNRVAILREVTLGEEGQCRATDTRELRGAAAAGVRHERRGIAPEKLRERDERETRYELNAGGDVAVSAAGLDALDGPVTLRREAEGSSWAITREDEAEAVVDPDPLFEQLPAQLTPAPPKEGKAAEKPEPRRGRLLLPIAYEATLEYRLTPPPGFRAAAPLPPDRSDRWGPATFTARSEVGRDGRVTVRYSLSLPRRELAPAEADALLAGVAAFTTSDGPRVRFERTARALLAEGRGREAIAELQRLVAREPRKARHRIHLAAVFLELGLGEAARGQARKAVELAPGDAWPHRALGWVLQHDGLGRLHAPGCDPAGAVAELRRALELEESPGARLNLARVLRLGRGCDVYGAGASLQESAEQFLAAREAGDGSAAAEELEVALRAGRLEQAAALARADKTLEARQGALVAAEAVRAGAQAALAEATRLAPQGRAELMGQAYLHLTRLRRYPLAVALLEQVAGPEAAGALEPLRRLRPFEQVKLDPTDPRVLPMRLMVALLAGDGDALEGLLAVRAGVPTRSGLSRDLEVGLRGAREKLDLSREVMADSALATMSTEADCLPRLACRLTVRSTAGASPFELLAVWERGGWRLLGDSPMAATELGALARARLDAGDAPAAKTLLGWARALLGQPDPEGASPAGALARLLPEGREATAMELGIAALALEGHSSTPGPGLRALAAAAVRAGDPARRALQWALADAHDTLENHAEVLRVADGLLADRPGDGAAVRLRARALDRLGRRREARAALEARTASAPDEAATVWLLARLAASDGDLSAHQRALAALVARGKAGSAEYNELAWGALFREPLAPGALADARRAVDLAKGGSAELHTLASVLADSGRPADAIQVLRRSVDARGGPLLPDDWWVIGQVSELYGALDAAAAAYRKVEPSAGASPLGSHRLARRRLERLGL